jgi:hypothetical protein
LFPEGFAVGLVTAPSNGEVIIDEQGDFMYIPDEGYVGMNAFSYSLDNGQMDNPIIGSVAIQVRPDVITNAIYTDAGFQASDQIAEGDLDRAAAATQSMGNAILAGVAASGAMDDGAITMNELFNLNYYLLDNYVDTEAYKPIWVDGAGQQVTRSLPTADDIYYVGAWGDWHGDDAGGRLQFGYTGSAIEHGYHLIQNDGGTTTFDGQNLWTTVADGIFHLGNDIVYTDANGDLQFADDGYIEGVDYYFLNEDGNQNENLEDVARWLSELLTY